jgi:hypothetical protein
VDLSLEQPETVRASVLRAIRKNAPNAGAVLSPGVYLWYGTNEYNFEKLPNPPAYEPTKCS